jgi:hypothetical protein
MAGDKDAGWLNSLAAVWNAGSLDAWIAKLIGLLIVLLAVTAMTAWLQSRSGGSSKALAGGGGMRARLAGRGAPPKNRKKKEDKIVRRYRPRSGTKPMRRTRAAAPGKAMSLGGAKPGGASLWGPLSKG